MEDFGSPIVMQVLRNLQQILIKAELIFIPLRRMMTSGSFY